MKKKFFKGYFSSSVTMQDYGHIVTLGSFLTFLPPVPTALCGCSDDTLPP